MKKLVTMALLAAAICGSTIVDANAWTRNTHVYGWRGQSSVHASGSCGNGSCSRQVTRTAPYGNTAFRQGSVSCGNGSCSGTRTTTGPNGGSVTRNRTASW